MTGYESKRAAARGKLNDDDDIQVYKREWVDLTEAEIEAIGEIAFTKQWAIRMALTVVKKRNA
jgi:hypothetical protein